MRYFISIFYTLVLAFNVGCTALAAQSEDIPSLVGTFKDPIKEDERLQKEAQKQKESEEQTAMEKFLNTELKTIEPLGIKGRPVTQQIAVTASVRRFQQTGAVEPIIAGTDLILYPYGLSEPKMVCAFLTTCSIELQEGERIQSKHPGDSQRWWFGDTVTGSGDTMKPVVIVKPLVKEQISTNLLISTDRRIYDIHLESVIEGPFTPRIGFFYPQDSGPLPVYGNFQPPPTTDEENVRVNLESISDWNFHYGVKGKKETGFYPKQIFDDGKKVYIRMPEGIESSEIPVFFAVGPGGNREVVNYRYKNGFFVIDRLIKVGVLLLNTNGKEEKVTIIKL